MTATTSLPATAVTGASTTTPLELAGRGDQLASKQLVDPYDGLVHSVPRSFRLQPADVLDVVQTTWLRRTIRDPQRLAGWLAVTASRESLAILRKASTHDLDPVVDQAPDPASDVEACVTDSDTAETLGRP